MEWTSNGPRSNLESGLVPGGRSVRSVGRIRLRLCFLGRSILDTPWSCRILSGHLDGGARSRCLSWDRLQLMLAVSAQRTGLSRVHLDETGQFQAAQCADLTSHEAGLKGRLTQGNAVAMGEREALVAVRGRLRIENVRVAADLLAVQEGAVHASQIGDEHVGRLDLENSVVPSGGQVALGQDFETIISAPEEETPGPCKKKTLPLPGTFNYGKSELKVQWSSLLPNMSSLH